jgi:PAS domain S-box-containing protein
MGKLNIMTEKTNNSFLENLLETSNTFIVTLDKNAAITSFNRYAEELTQYTASEVLGKDWFSLFVPERDKGLVPTVFKDTLEKQTDISHYENPIVLRNGTERMITWSNNTLRDSTGIITGILSVGIDITDKHAVDLALRKSEQLQKSYLKAISSIGLGLLVIDSNFRVCDMNDILIEWFGDQRGEICYRSIGDRKSPCPYCRLKDVVNGRETVRYKPRTADGRVFDIVATPLGAESNEATKLEIIVDITEQEKQFQCVQDLTVNLEKRIEQRTNELQHSNEQLKLQKKEIEEKNIALRVMLDQQQAAREELEENMVVQLKKLIHPYLDLLLKTAPEASQAKDYIKIIAAHVDSVARPFARKLHNPVWQLTPREIIVADLVRSGKNTHEIGRLLSISPRTAERYRTTIRKKIGLTKKKISLHAYLNTHLR